MSSRKTLSARELMDAALRDELDELFAELRESRVVVENYRPAHSRAEWLPAPAPSRNPDDIILAPDVFDLGGHRRSTISCVSWQSS